MVEPDYAAMSKDELIDLWRDATQPEAVRDAAYREAYARMQATSHERHSPDDEPEG